MTSQFLTFQKFTTKEDALVLKESLEREGIQTLLEDTSPSVDVTFSGNTHENEFLLKVKQDEFEKANVILEKHAEAIVDQFGDDHYLFEFSDEELYELIEKSDEWSKEDFLLAVKILKGRGHDLSTTKIDEIKAKRMQELRKPVEGKPGWIAFGYFAAVVGGLLGLMIGWSHWKSTKLDPTGERFFVYDENTRKTGKRIFWIAVVFTIIGFYVILTQEIAKAAQEIFGY